MVTWTVVSMAPKKGRTLTKAQRAKKQREAEERRLREEEEARLQAEKEEQERLKREKIKEELERLESRDLERREDELNELRHLLEGNHTAVTVWKKDALERAEVCVLSGDIKPKKEWERYIRCDGLPDPKEQREMNTFISLWRDDPCVDITPVLEHCNVAVQLMEELEALLRDATDPQESQKYQETFINLQELIQSKHLLISEEILKNATENADKETGNMKTVIRDENITLCLWANLKVNPRFKGLNFDEVCLGFELPKQLSVSNTAIRILHTRYDHLTVLALIAQQRIQRASHSALFGPRSLAGDEDVPLNVDGPEQEEEKEEGKEEEDNGTKKEKDEEEVQSSQGAEERKSEASFKSRSDSVQSARSRASQIQTQIEALEIAESDVISDPLQNTVKNQEVQVVDLMQYTPLGGVFFYNMFHLPPQSCQVGGWVMRQILKNGLQVFPYPVESSPSNETSTPACPPVGVTVTLPECVVFWETPQVAHWDAAGEQWRMDGISDVSYDEAEAKISFKADSFQAFVLMQETYVNFPFQSWELRPLEQNSALLTVNGALINISITVKDDQCMLQSEHERGLSHLKGKWMSVSALQRAMLNAGINIFVNEYTDNYVSTNEKDPPIESAAYEQMALFASACAFSWSKWNAKCRAEHLVIQACEHHGPAPVPRDSWRLYLLGAQRSKKLEITEKSEAFSPDHYPGSEFHSTFIHMLQDDMSADGVTKTRESDHLFVDTVQSLLCATRLLIYS